MSRITDMIHKVIELTKERDEENLMIRMKYHTDRQGFLTTPGFLEEPRPAKTALLAYLKTMDRTDLITVAAVMYGGREYDDSFPKEVWPLDEMYAHLQANPHLAEMMIAKAPLGKYLGDGLKIYEKELAGGH